MNEDYLKTETKPNGAIPISIVTPSEKSVIFGMPVYV